VVSATEVAARHESTVSVLRTVQYYSELVARPLAVNGASGKITSLGKIMKAGVIWQTCFII
jgi:hypothetical protein